MPQRGEVWLVDLGLAQKTRPALVLSVQPGEVDRVVVTVISHTTSLRESPYEIVVPTSFLREGAFLVQNITTIPSKHALRRLGRLTPAQLQPIEAAVRQWLAL